MNDFIDFAKSVTGVLTALATLIGAFSAFFSKFPRGGSKPTPVAEEKKTPPQRRRRLGARRVIGCLLFASSLAIGVVGLLPDRRPLNEVLMHRAWASFKPAYDSWINENAIKETKLRLAIRYSEQCESLFGELAEAKQKELEQKSVTQPSNNPESEGDKKLLLERGLLNDVATSRWIIGRSHQILGEKDLAAKWYKKAANLTFARTLNANGNGFWAPAEDANARITELGNTRESK